MRSILFNLILKAICLFILNVSIAAAFLLDSDVKSFFDKASFCIILSSTFVGCIFSYGFRIPLKAIYSAIFINQINKKDYLIYKNVFNLL